MYILHRKLRQEDYKFKAYQGYRASSNAVLMDLVPGSVDCLPVFKALNLVTIQPAPK